MRFSFPKATVFVFGLLIATYCFKSSYATTLPNLAINRTVTASSLEGASFPASNVVDNNLTTRWSSQFSDPQWISIDLGSSQTIGEVVINWETSYAKAYTIDVSSDGSTWVNVKTITNGTGGRSDFSFTPVAARYVRMYGTQRSNQYGYSIFEFEVYGTGEPASAGVWKLNGSNLYYPDGNVGIGTSQMDERLNVNGNIVAVHGNVIAGGDGSIGSMIYHRSNISAPNKNHLICPKLYYEGLISGTKYGSDPDTSKLLWGLHINALPFDYGQDDIFYHAGDHNFYTTTLTNGVAGKETRKMLIAQNGNVAIGPDLPEEKLDVSGNLWVRGDRWTTANDFAKINFGDTNHTIRSIFGVGMVFRTYGQPNALVLKQVTGNVGIGTDPGNYKLKVQGDVGITNNLTVTGSIKTQDLVVSLTNAAGWPDYVFTKEHKLPSIEQTEQFIKDNGHLQGMPTNAQVAEKGVNVAEMQAKLLEKVEQLTLYVIDLKKENADLKKQMEALKAK